MKKRLWLLITLLLVVAGAAAGVRALWPAPINPGDQVTVASLKRYCSYCLVSNQPANLEQGDVFELANGFDCCLNAGATLTATAIRDDYVMATVTYPEKTVQYGDHVMVWGTRNHYSSVECGPNKTIALTKTVWRDIHDTWMRDADETRNRSEARKRQHERSEKIKNDVRRKFNAAQP